MAHCHYHPDRPAVALCMRCKYRICDACSTRIDGVNHCHACLKVLGQRSERRGLDAWAVLAVGLAGLSWLALVGVCWILQGGLSP